MTSDLILIPNNPGGGKGEKQDINQKTHSGIKGVPRKAKGKAGKGNQRHPSLGYWDWGGEAGVIRGGRTDEGKRGEKSQSLGTGQEHWSAPDAKKKVVGGEGGEKEKRIGVSRLEFTGRGCLEKE